MTISKYYLRQFCFRNGGHRQEAFFLTQTVPLFDGSYRWQAKSWLKKTRYARLINNSLKNRRSLGIEEDYNKLIQYYISQNNIGLKEIVNKIILNSEKISALTRTEFITTIICGYICGINKLDLIRAMNIYKLAISCDSIFINRLLNNKDYLEYWNNNFLSLTL